MFKIGIIIFIFHYLNLFIIADYNIIIEKMEKRYTSSYKYKSKLCDVCFEFGT